MMIIKNLKIAIIILLSFTLLLRCSSYKDPEILNLKCEYVSDPIAVGVQKPRLSWQLKSGKRGQRQSAYQILVSSTQNKLDYDQGDMWDTGKIDTCQSSHIKYGGLPLQSNQTYFWKVRIWDKDATVTPYSKPAKFSMALLDPNDWQARWIGRGLPEEPRGTKGYLSSPAEQMNLPDTVHQDGRSTLLRKIINITKPLKEARVYICGLGLYELYINGNKVGDAVLTPAKTNYRKQILYDTYDITELLAEGKNAIGIMLGNGWFNPYKKWWSWRMQWFGSQRAIVQLHISYGDDSKEMLLSDETWKASTGPIYYSCIYDGERYDANLELPGWNMSDFDDSDWSKVNVVEPPGGKMISQMMEPIRITEAIKPVAVNNPKPGVYVYDMGQNFAGWARLNVTGPQGTKVVLRYAENIDKYGMIDTRSMNLAEATGIYILKGMGREVYQPRFTFYGFRYVEITGFPGTPDLNNLEGSVVHSDCPMQGKFACGNPLVNRIHNTTLWSQRSNMIGYPMDCPQRDERLGWMGDAHATAEEAMLNFHMPLFYRNWLSGIQTNQDDKTRDIPYISPRPFMEEGDVAWSSGYILIVWYYYLQYGDRQIIEEHYDNMKQYVEFLGKQAKNSILPKDKYGDWVSVVNNWQRGDPESVTTAYYYYNSIILSKSAAVLGLPAEAQKYEKLAQQIKTAYNKKFLNASKKQYEQGTQCSNAFPLFLDMVPEEYQIDVLKNLINDILVSNQGHVTTGILGSKYMLEALTNNKRSDIAYLLAMQKDYPSWGDLIRNRTTLSEHWNQSGSNNHVMFGSIDTWFYRTLAGINIDERKPGYNHIIIKPFFHPELVWVDGSVVTMKGEVSSRWEFDEDALKLAVRIPANATGTVYLPVRDDQKVTENDRPVKNSPGISYKRREGNFNVYDIESGNYRFESLDIADFLPEPYASKPNITPEETFIAIPDTAIVSITSATPEALIYYTLDGSEPNEKSKLFQKPIILRNSTIVKAKAFKEGYQPSFCQSLLFNFVDPQKNGLRYELYVGAFTRLPEFEKLTPDKNGRVYQFGLSGIDAPEYDFALQLSGFIEITKAGEYTFYTVSNDGSQLFVNNKLVVNNDGEHIATEESGKIFLSSGLHPIKVNYFQSGGGQTLEVLYQGPGIDKQVIPARCFLISN